MILVKIYRNLDWNVYISDPNVLKDGWWKLSEFCKDNRLRIDWNIINNENIFLDFLNHITGLTFEKESNDIYTSSDCILLSGDL